MDLSDELAAIVTRLYPTQLLRSADEIGGVKLSFITNNRLYQLSVQTEDAPNEFTLTVGTENPFMEAPPGGMQAFVRAMRARHPSAGYAPGGPHGADFSANASGRKLFGLPLEAEFLRCKQTIDLCLNDQGRVAGEM
jgi:hypothetical protein